jgi:hypothetical protein
MEDGVWQWWLGRTSSITLEQRRKETGLDCSTTVD